MIRTQFLRHWPVRIALMIGCALATQTVMATTIPPADSQWALTLVNSISSNQSLRIHLDIRDGKIVAALGQGYNARTHTVDTTGLNLDKSRLTGVIKVTLNPDAYVPSDGKPVNAEFTLDVKTDAGAVTGDYQGKCGSTSVKGGVNGMLAPIPDPAAYRRFNVHFDGALARLFQTRGINWKYALDMNLTVPFKDGKFTGARFETPVPDYRRYSATVQSCDLKLDGPRLTGKLAVQVNYGEQNKTTGKFVAELHEYTVNALVINDLVGGVFAAKVGDLAVTDYGLHGSVSFAPPPSTQKSIVWLRLHGGIKDNHPILLSLSLSDQWPPHGLAYCPSENHQTDTVDATLMKATADQLEGAVKVTVYPDVYRGGEPFDVHCVLNTKIDGAEVSGTFTGEDRGVKTSGIVTGELRARSEPVVAKLDQLRECQLNLGYSLVSSTLPHQQAANANHTTVILTFHDGKISGGKVVNTSTPDAYSATFDTADIRIQGDHLTGWVEFTATSNSISSGKYRFELEAMINGDNLNGYWRGTHKDKRILTKSAKLNGKLTAATP